MLSFCAKSSSFSFHITSGKKVASKRGSRTNLLKFNEVLVKDQGVKVFEYDNDFSYLDCRTCLEGISSSNEEFQKLVLEIKKVKDSHDLKKILALREKEELGLDDWLFIVKNCTYQENSLCSGHGINEAINVSSPENTITLLRELNTKINEMKVNKVLGYNNRTHSHEINSSHRYVEGFLSDFSLFLLKNGGLSTELINREDFQELMVNTSTDSDESRLELFDILLNYSGLLSSYDESVVDSRSVDFLRYGTRAFKAALEGRSESFLDITHGLSEYGESIVNAFCISSSFNKNDSSWRTGIDFLNLKFREGKTKVQCGSNVYDIEEHLGEAKTADIIHKEDLVQNYQWILDMGELHAVSTIGLVNEFSGESGKGIAKEFLATMLSKGYTLESLPLSGKTKVDILNKIKTSSLYFPVNHSMDLSSYTLTSKNSQYVSFSKMENGKKVYLHVFLPFKGVQSSANLSDLVDVMKTKGNCDGPFMVVNLSCGSEKVVRPWMLATLAAKDQVHHDLVAPIIFGSSNSFETGSAEEILSHLTYPLGVLDLILQNKSLEDVNRFLKEGESEYLPSYEKAMSFLPQSNVFNPETTKKFIGEGAVYKLFDSKSGELLKTL